MTRGGVDGHFWSEVIYGWLLSSRSKSVPIILITTYHGAIFVLSRLCTSPKKQNQIPAYVLPNASEDLFIWKLRTLEETFVGGDRGMRQRGILKHVMFKLPRFLECPRGDI